MRKDRLQPVVCAEIMAEYEAVLSRPRFALPEADVIEVLSLFGAQAIWVHIGSGTASVPGLPDPGDWPFVASAIAADCPVITGNIKHFPPKTGAQAIAVREWLSSPRKLPPV
jgi:hypothetical protein